MPAKPWVRIAALALVPMFVAARSTESGCGSRPRTSDTDSAHLSPSALLAALRAEKWPTGLALQAYHSDHELFLVPKHREAQSPLMNSWNAFTRDEKLEVLDEVRSLHTPFALPYLAEIAWFVLPQGQRRSRSPIRRSRGSRRRR